MKIPFYKMQGAGNDFIVVDNQQLQLTREQLVTLTKKICQRRISVGSDALMVVDTPQKNGDVRMVFFNADGTEAEMCGNGARCLARYAYEKKLAGDAMVIETVAGDVPAWRLTERTYKVELNEPTVEQFNLEYEDNGTTQVIDYVELGNPGLPHVVVRCDELWTKPLEVFEPFARNLRHWSNLPKGANVNLYAIDHQGKILLRTFERGVEGFTLACGTGAGATAYSLIQKGLVPNTTVSLHTLGGILEVDVQDHQLFLSGDTNIIVEGSIMDEDLNI